MYLIKSISLSLSSKSMFLYIMSIILGITLISVVIWISYELWRAPLYDEATMKIIRPTKTLKDLFKKKK